uniref:Cyclin B3 n=1 Tax=Paramormyrops kingsleyae TaxID=1676925 RepID=A0A3B3R6Y9_9TELE
MLTAINCSLCLNQASNCAPNNNQKMTVKMKQKSSAVKKEAAVKKYDPAKLVVQPENVKVAEQVALEEPAETPKGEASQSQLSVERVIQVPEDFDIDTKNLSDCGMAPEYAMDIFGYLKTREEKFILENYMHKQSDLNEDMRSILVDWMVEVQENFELYHETLYLAVKLTDHYLSTSVITREVLQLIGSTSMLIACKSEERCPPCVDDLLYICDDAYKRDELIAMERNILMALNFDINIPVAYSFLRRYARCVQADMVTLTLARYVCERSLLEMEFISERASLLASGCLLIALILQGLGGWNACLEYHTGYSVSALAPLVQRLYAMLARPSSEKLKAVTNKYSHSVFFEVAKTPLVTLEKLRATLN